MAIVPLAKLTLVGLPTDKPAVLHSLQQAGCSHLISMTDDGKQKPTLGEGTLQAHEALKYLESSPVKRPETTHPTDFQFSTVVEEAVGLQAKQRELSDERDSLSKAIQVVGPWGNFRVPSAEELAGQRLWFYQLPPNALEKLASSNLIYSVVQSDQRHARVVVISPTEPAGVPGTRIDLDPRSLTELSQRKDHIEAQLERLLLDRAALTRWITLIKREINAADDLAHLHLAGSQTLDTNHYFVAQAWAPWDGVPAIQKIADQHRIALEVAQPTDDENPPTLLRNPEFLAGGQSAVTFYLTPGYRWWDPSLVVLFSFAVFFAMIISDFGYSALLAIVLGFLWKSLGKTVDGRRLRNLTLILVGFSLVWGVIVGSYFGIAPPKDSFLGKLVLIDTTNLNQMMLLSIIVGASHLVIANAITAWRTKSSIKVLVPVGWIMAIVGGLLFGMASYDQLGKGFGTIGSWLLTIGIPLAIFMNSDQPLPPRSIWHVLGRLGDGVKNLMAVSAAFGDTLSYLRLFALGLSGAQLASTFNKLAVDSVQAFGALGLILAIVIILVGHSLNFVLGIMGGVIHGLRLNCIEFFNWCATEEGYPFRAFSKKA
jgi:V/A-type H+/Na+-transporting ATPase subunit I